MICQLLSNWGRKIFVISEPSDEMDGIGVFHDCVFTWLVSVSLSFKATLVFLKISGRAPYCHMRIEGFPNGNL